MKTQTNQQLDPWGEALDPKQPSQTVYGQILFDLYFCALVKGQGKVPFDPQQHTPRQRRTAINVDIVPLPESELQWDITREFIAEIRTDGWLQVTLPSLRALGVTDLQALHESYVKCELEKYGSYTNAQGEDRDLTAPKILEVYESREACVEAFENDQGGSAEPTSSTASANGETPQAAAPAGTGASKKTALQFLPAIVRSCRSGNDIDTEALEQKLAENPILAAHFDMTSPEVMEAVEKALQEPPF